MMYKLDIRISLNNQETFNQEGEVKNRERREQAVIENGWVKRDEELSGRREGVSKGGG